MSVLFYNNVTLPYSNTTNFVQEAVYDESKTDFMLVKFDITVQCIVNIDYLNLLAPDLVTRQADFRSAADVMNIIRSRLLTPKRTLMFKFNGADLIPQNPNRAANAGTTDAANGPQPQSCKCDHLYNSTFLVTYRVIAHYWEANIVDPNAADARTFVRNASNTSPIISNRWTEMQEIDNRSLSKFTRHGKMVMRSDNFQGDIIDRFRYGFAVCGLRAGYLRESSTYKVDPSGLALEYTIIDREVVKLPPEPAYEATGYYTETSTMNAALRFGEVHLILKASKDTDRNALLLKAIDVATAKVILQGAHLQNTASPRFARLEFAVMKIDLYDNIVMCALKVQMKPRSRSRILGFPTPRIETFGDTPFSDPGVAPVSPPFYGHRGTVGPNLLLRAAAYYDPSLSNAQTIMNSNSQTTAGLEPGQGGVQRGINNP